MPLPPALAELVGRFERHRDAYKNPAYLETQVRREFLDPFFEALGWDVTNKQGHAEAYKDVVHEDAIKVGSATKAPDYSFRVGGTRKFFVEAKRPSVNLKDDPTPAYQLRRYAWSAHLPLSILTDFEEFVVYDCRKKPDQHDKASVARLLYFTYADYAEKWDQIAAIFSRDAVLKGSFDQYAESGKGKRGTANVDAALLAEIESWRELLAKNLALRNPELTQKELNFAVQRTIDRLIFLRMCEDRGVEEYGQLQRLLDDSDIYAGLVKRFKRADERYNSGLFHFSAEKDRAEAPDTLTPSLNLDDKTLKEIIGNLYYPQSPYEFSVLPPEILGQVYEQFLGKVIRLTAGHRAVVEDKPDVRKAGGVYYTPSYIVDYIVKNTVGKLLGAPALRDDRLSRAREEAGPATARNHEPLPHGRGSDEPASGCLTPKQAAKLRILDPACGSGSFLVGAYQFLLDWHRDWYVADGPENHRKELYQGKGGLWYLATDVKRKILLNNIYGVDIDAAAVEVTKLSLLLKVLEDESAETLAKQLRLFHERALPDLGSNIKCGNSLIGPDFYQQQQGELFDDETRERINAFDWEEEFPLIMAAGGFDAVIGNPPYIRIQVMKEWAPREVEFYSTHYKSASKGNYDIYVVFVERGLGLLNQNGRLGFILPHKFFQSQYGAPLRSLLTQGRHLNEIVHFAHHQVFAGATTYTCLLFLQPEATSHFRIVQVDDLAEWTSGLHHGRSLSADDLGDSEWSFVREENAGLFAKLVAYPTNLGDLAHLFVGLQTDADDVFILEAIEDKGNRTRCHSKATGREHWLETSHLKRLLKGSLDIRRYCLSEVSKRLIFPYEERDGASVLIEKKEYEAKYPLTWHYLQENRARLAARNKGDMGPDWHGYVYKKNHLRFGHAKLVVPSIAKGSCFAADEAGEFFFVGSGGGGGGGYGITLLDESSGTLKYLLGILNSNLATFYLKVVSTPFRGGYIALNRQYIEQVPIRTINFADPAEKAQHDRMVQLVERMLELNRKKPGAKTPQEITRLERDLAATDREIDQLVYALYGLTAEEIKIVEGAAR